MEVTQQPDHFHQVKSAAGSDVKVKGPIISWRMLMQNVYTTGSAVTIMLQKNKSFR